MPTVGAVPKGGTINHYGREHNPRMESTLNVKWGLYSPPKWSHTNSKYFSTLNVRKVRTRLTIYQSGREHDAGVDSNRVFAIYLILLGWKTHKCYYGTVELPNPRLSQPNKKLSQQWHLGHFFPTASIFSWVGIDFMQETDYKKPNLTKFSANILISISTGGLYSRPQ